MRSLCKVALTLALVVLIVSPALAQRQQRGQRGQRGQGGFFQGRGGFGGGAAALLQNEGVQKELKMDQAQIEKAQKITQDVRAKFRDDFTKLQDVPQEQRFQKMQELNQKISDETMKALKDVLKDEQVKRLNQIQLQQRGIDAFTDSEVQTALKLTGEQKDKIKTITDDFRRDQREIFQGARGGNFQEAQQKTAALRKETLEKVTSLLNADQKKAWKDLTGEPFEVRFQFGRGRGRGGNQ
jgi:Spy/CpxP family protein refolding chaperone